MNIENIIEQNIHLIGRSVLELTGISDVASFSEYCIEAEFSDGCIAVDGSELKIVDFSSQTGLLKVTGLVDGIYFIDKLRSRKKKSFLK